MQTRQPITVNNKVEAIALPELVLVREILSLLVILLLVVISSVMGMP